jgi:hypothetical protein
MVVVIIITIILMPIGLVMMTRMRTTTQQNRRMYESLILTHAARAGVEAIFEQLRAGNFAMGPHTAEISDGVRYRSYVDTRGIGLIGQKICSICSRGEGDGGGSVLIVVNVEVYPNTSPPYLTIPHSYYVFHRDLFIDDYAARTALLNTRDMQYGDYVYNLKIEGNILPSDYQEQLEELFSSLPPAPALQQSWKPIIVPALLEIKANP